MRQNKPSRARHAFVAVLAGVVSAACATTRYTESAFVTPPRNPDGAAAAAASRSGVSIEIERVKLRIETTDRAPRGTAIPRLGLRIVLDPPELGYSFDPGQVVLRSVDGREWRASGEGYRPVFPKASFNVAFDAVVPEGSTFEIEISGLARGQTRLGPVTLRLARRSGRSIDRVYWLEALLAPLAYAPYY